MLFQVLCGFEPIFYTTHPNEESIFYVVSFYKNIFPICSFFVTTDSIYNTTTTDTCLLSDWN